VIEEYYFDWVTLKSWNRGKCVRVLGEQGLVVIGAGVQWFFGG
jgi:hypothetical protein